VNNAAGNFPVAAADLSPNGFAQAFAGSSVHGHFLAPNHTHMNPRVLDRRGRRSILIPTTN